VPKAAHFSQEKLPTTFALVLPDDMNPHPNNGKPSKLGTPVGQHEDPLERWQRVPVVRTWIQRPYVR